MKAVIIPIASPIAVKNVVVATDFSYASSQLATAAAALGKHFRCSIHFVHVRPDVTGMPDPFLATRSAEEIQQDTRNRMAELLRHPDLDGVDVHGRLLVGEPATRILDLADAEKPDLIVVGTHGAKGLKHFLLGSIAEEIFRHARCPVLTLGPKGRVDRGRERTVKTILVPVDLSEESRQAVPVAAGIAADFQACVRFVHVAPKEALSSRETIELKEHLSHEIQRQVGSEVPPTCRSEVVIEFGDEVAGIVTACHETKADLIVMGLHRHTTSAGLRSSITYRTILDADCPVLTVRRV